MSDSDDDAAFASADEGDVQKSNDTKESTGKKDIDKTGITKKEADKSQSKAEAVANVKVEEKTSQKKGGNDKGKKKGKQAKKKTEKQDTKTDAKQEDAKENVKTKDEVKVENKQEKSNKTDKAKVDEKSDELQSDKVKEPEKLKTKSVEPEKSGEETVVTSEPTEKLIKSPSGQNIQRESGEKPEIKSALDQLVDDDDDDEEEEEGADKQPSNWNWGGWGSSILNVAQTSVTTFTSQVGEGFNTIMDTMENTLGAIPPEEMAFMKHTDTKEKSETEESTDQTQTQEKSEEKESESKETAKKSEEENVEKKSDEKKSDEKVEKKSDENKEKKSDEKDEEKKSEEVKSDTASGGGGGWFSSWGVSSLKDAVAKTSNIVQSTSKNIVHGGMDVLETVGKKAFDFIEDHDPGLHKSKEVLFDRGGKANLSQILKEAKEEADSKAEMEKESEEARKAHFGFLFDEYQGISHLEALEILSNQCEKKVQVLLTSVSSETLNSIKSQLIEIKQIFEHESDEDDDDEEQEHEFVKVMTELLTDLHLGTTPDKINRVQEKIRKEITDFYVKQENKESVEPKVMHQKAIQSLAELTSKAMEQFHKAGELILIQKDSDKNFVDRAKCLLSINKLLSTEVSILSTKFSHCLNKIGEDLEDDSCINQMVTNVYLEASNSSTYIHDGFQLLLPCLQQAAIENTPGIAE